jgi:hypothetical protein
MTSKRELILQAAAAALVGTNDVGTRIWRSRLEAFQRSEAPAIVIEPGNDEASAPSASNCYIDWNFTLLVAIYTRGHQPEQIADPIVCDVHARLMTDRSLGGLAMDLWPIAVEPSFEKADRPALWTVMTYRVRYRTTTTSLIP